MASFGTIGERIDDGSPRLVRVDYDVEGESQVLLRSGYPDAPRLAEMLASGRFLRPDKGSGPLGSV